MKFCCYAKFVFYRGLALLALAIIFSASMGAQKISVSRFILAESDLTAQNRNTSVEDQNGDKCALIRIQTTQKGFTFDVGSAGIQKVEDNHIGEIWVYVPFGVRHISIRHPQLGSLPDYDFPINIEKARTYIMEITTDKVFVNYYDDTRKQKLHIKVIPANSKFTLNGMKVTLDTNGESTQELSFGTYTYKVEAGGFYPKESQITINDSTQPQKLLVNDLKPIMGKISVHANPYSAKIMIDGVFISSKTSLTPYPLKVGHHKLLVKSEGYKTEERDVIIEKDKTTDIEVVLGQLARFSFSTHPTGATLKIDGEYIGMTPCSKELKTGSYDVWATKKGYKDYKKRLSLSSSNPTLNFSLSKIYNYKDEFYAELGVRVGTYIAFGGTIGGYISNFNIETSAHYGIGNSETIYWCGNDTKPVSCVYHPQLSFSGKVGYGIPIGTRFRFTPQIGANFLRLKESMPDGANISPADGCSVASVLCGLRFSVVIANHIGISLSPEYSFAICKSRGFKELEQISSKIKKWGEEINVRLGLMIAL